MKGGISGNHLPSGAQSVLLQPWVLELILLLFRIERALYGSSFLAFFFTRNHLFHLKHFESPYIDYDAECGSVMPSQMQKRKPFPVRFPSLFMSKENQTRFIVGLLEVLVDVVGLSQVALCSIKCFNQTPIMAFAMNWDSGLHDSCSFKPMLTIPY